MRGWDLRSRVKAGLLLGVAVAGGIGAATASAAQVKLDMAQAKAEALKVAPGTIKSSELEKESGGSGQRYSFDIQTARGLREVGIDANSGKILENSGESPGDEAREARSETILKARPAIEVSAAPGRFDLMAVDSARHRLLAAHSQAGTLAVINLNDNKLERNIPVGKSSGVAIDARDGKYFVGTDKGVAVVDRKSLGKVAFIDTRGPADDMAFDPNNGRLYVAHDDGSELWVINAGNNKVVGHIKIPGTPELMAMDAGERRLYLNIKSRDELVVIDTAEDKVVNSWSTLPTHSPHGLILDHRDHQVLIGGHGHAVTVFSTASGKRLNGIEVAGTHVDQMAFDSKTRRLYFPDQGRLVAARISGHRIVKLGEVPIPKGAHTVAIDPHTHNVWISYSTKHSYVQAFQPTAG